MKVGLYYFSATGNTQLVAEIFRDQFIKRGDTVDLLRIEEILKNGHEVNCDAYDRIGIGHPVHGFTTPKVVLDLIKAMPKGNGKKVFIFKTAGGPVPINFNASKTAIRNLVKKGYDVFYDRIIPIGSNWVTGFRSDVIRQLYQTARHKVKISCEEMDEGKTRLMKAGFPLSIVIGVVAFLHDRLIWVLGKDYAVSSTCNLCGKCVRNCPTGNIIVKNGKIRFKLSCLWCMRCIYGCPQNAIRHRLLSFAVLPSGYDIDKILESDSAEETGIGRTPPYLQDYIHNDQM